jgi:hypothetical protein
MYAEILAETMRAAADQRDAILTLLQTTRAHATSESQDYFRVASLSMVVAADESLDIAERMDEAEVARQAFGDSYVAILDRSCAC